MNVQGKVAVVTGAGSGIGQAVAVELAERGVRAIGLVDRSENVLRAARTINSAVTSSPRVPLFRTRSYCWMSPGWR